MILLSWNLIGYRSHFEELQLLSVDHKPTFLCLQETHLLPEHHLRLRGYVCYRKDTVDGLHANGGVAILVHDSIHSQEIAFQSTLPVVAVKINMTHLSFIVCSLYLPPGQPLSATDLFDLFSELPTPFIIVGDFNAHNSMPRPALEHTPHWIFGRADWVKFRASILLADASFKDVIAMAQHFTNAILTAAKASILQFSGMARHPPIPWWNRDCALAIQARKQTLTHSNATLPWTI